MNQLGYQILPKVAWDRESPIYSHAKDAYYDGLEYAESDLEEGETLADLQLAPCKPCYVRPLDKSYCEDEMPDDDPWCELPQEVQQAMDDFNLAVQGIIISWTPDCRSRLDIDES